MSLVDEAVIFAAECHRDMRRKHSALPYILHPMEVAVIAATMTDDEEVLAAAVLHDVVEDTPAEAEEILQRFGPRVALLVASETEDKHPEMDKSDSWKMRKQESLKDLENSEDPGVRILWLSDKLANMRSFYRDYQEKGDDLWKAFNQSDVKEQHWYYSSIRRILSSLKHTEAWQEYSRLVNEIFKSIVKKGMNRE